MKELGVSLAEKTESSTFYENLCKLNGAGLKEAACILIEQFARERAEQSLEEVTLYVQILSLLKDLNSEGLERVVQYAEDISSRFPS